MLFVKQVCKWCTNCPRGHCIAASSDCEREGKCKRTVVDMNQCAESKCPASDCDKCDGLGSCVWTRQVLLSRKFLTFLHLFHDFSFRLKNVESEHQIACCIVCRSAFAS